MFKKVIIEKNKLGLKTKGPLPSLGGPGVQFPADAPIPIAVP